MIVYLVLVTLTCWVEKPSLAAEQEEKRSVSEKQFFTKSESKRFEFCRKPSCASCLSCAATNMSKFYTFYSSWRKKKNSNLCVKSAEMSLVQRELLTSLLSAPRRSASLCQLRKWVFHPADASWLGTLSGAHPAAASRGSGSAHRSRKKRSLKKFWCLIKSVSTLKITEVLREHKETTAQERFREISCKDCRWKTYVIMWHHTSVHVLVPVCGPRAVQTQSLHLHKKTWRCSCSAPFTQSAFESKEWKLSVIWSEHCCRPGCDISSAVFKIR